MRLRKFILMAIAMVGMCAAGTAQSAPLGRALIYIDPQEYQHEIHLWDFYYGYWYSQGRAVEPVALNAVQPLFGEAGMCQDGGAADVVVSIQPHMFYNPHMTMYYGSIVAQAYSGSGKPLATYRAEVQQSGFLDVLPGAKIQAVYREAMQKIAGQMQADASLMSLATQGLPENETKMPCVMVSVLRAKP